MGKPVETMIAKGQPYATEAMMPRRAMLFLMEDILAQYLVGPQAEPPIASARKWMADELRRDRGAGR